MSLVARLAELVSFDTQNPTGDERPLVALLARQLQGLGAAAVETAEVEGHAYVFARFGDDPPRVLVNAHVDTVPASPGYGAPPHRLVERGQRLVGLGAADTKGSIAAVMEALARCQAAGTRPRGVALLLSGDEERRSTCMRRFLTDRRLVAGLERAVVCEPTGCTAGWRHRGIAAAEARVTSPGGHSSRADEVAGAVAVLARAAVAADDLGRRYRDVGPAGYQGICLNVAALEGGGPFNVIPSRATLRLSLRPAPGADVAALLAEAEAVVRAAAAPVEVDWSVMTARTSFQTRDLESFVPLLGERVRRPVDLAFWTEAALLGEAGIDAVVFGPGHIEQAHAADEHVERAELETALETFIHLFESTG
jgi:acetylornithine deacetylase